MDAKNEELLKDLIDEVTLLKEIDLVDIPSIDLYMDQITTFFDDKLKHLKRDEDDSILTKTMINNYTKGKILMPPVKKKYSKEHIILLILIYNMKQVLSINDIQTLYSPLINSITGEDSEINIEQIYSLFLDIKKAENQTFTDNIESRLELINRNLKEDSNKQESTKLLLIVLMLVHQANLQKRLAEKIIDNYFNNEE